MFASPANNTTKFLTSSETISMKKEARTIAGIIRRNLILSDGLAFWGPPNSFVTRPRRSAEPLYAPDKAALLDDIAPLKRPFEEVVHKNTTSTTRSITTNYLFILRTLKSSQTITKMFPAKKGSHKDRICFVNATYMCFNMMHICFLRVFYMYHI